MNVELQIHMEEFQWRHYQRPIKDALESGKRFIIAILPRRAGKDFACWNLLIREAYTKPGIYWMIYPTYQMGKKIIWDGRTNDGKSFLSSIHPSMIKQIYQQDMKVRLSNESIIQIVGSDTPDRLVGANCCGAVFSEYALQDESIFHQIVRPMVQANSGFCIFISTPRGKGNDLWKLWNIAQDNPNWFAYKMDITQTGHISVSEIQALIDSGEMEEGLAKQEFWCSFDRGIEGAYYGSYLDKARLQGRIGHVPHEPGLLVHSAMDIGVNETSGKTALIFYQIAGQTVRVINCYQNHGLGVDHYIDKIMDYKKEYGYKYGYHFAPHDMKIREFGAGALTRYEQARQLGITFRILEQIRNLGEGINTCWLNFHKIYFDETNCKSLLDALENYRAEWDEIKKRHSTHPIKNWAVHYCFTADTEVLTDTGIRPIIELQDNDKVLTLNGWEKCTKAFLVKQNAELVEVKFSDGTKVKCTPDHMFLTEKGWIYAEELIPNIQVIQSNSMNLRNISKEKYIDYISTKNISHVPSSKDYIKKYGNLLLEKFQKIAIFITSMVIHLIMLFTTFNVYLRKNISKCLSQIIKELGKNVEKVQFAGMVLKKEEIGISSMQEDLILASTINARLDNVNGAKKRLMPWLDSGEQHRNIAIQTVKPLQVECVEKLSYLEDVYCITVPNVGHFSLSNGAIVKNCDAFRYMIQSLPLCDMRNTTPQELEKRFNQSVNPRGHEPSFTSHRY